MNEYKQQVKKTHYSFDKYFYKGRWMSYWYQADSILSDNKTKNVLDIGPGTDMLKSVLQLHKPEISYCTVDIASDLNPDILGSVTNLPIADDQYDTVCAFQVLEHIEFKDFEIAIKELKRVSRKRVLISLPHFGPSVEALIKLPFLRRKKFAFKIPFPKQHFFTGEHYWEIGKKGYSAKTVRSIIAQHLNIVEEFVPFENQYHHFFITEK